MPRFDVIDGTPPPDTPLERGRKRMRKAKVPGGGPSCHRCGGRETITATIGKVKNKLCVACLLTGHRSVVE